MKIPDRWYIKINTKLRRELANEYRELLDFDINKLPGIEFCVRKNISISNDGYLSDEGLSSVKYINATELQVVIKKLKKEKRSATPVSTVNPVDYIPNPLPDELHNVAFLKVVKKPVAVDTSDNDGKKIPNDLVVGSRTWASIYDVYESQACIEKNRYQVNFDINCFEHISKEEYFADNDKPEGNFEIPDKWFCNVNEDNFNLCNNYRSNKGVGRFGLGRGSVVKAGIYIDNFGYSVVSLPNGANVITTSMLKQALTESNSSEPEELKCELPVEGVISKNPFIGLGDFKSRPMTINHARSHGKTALMQEVERIKSGLAIVNVNPVDQIGKAGSFEEAFPETFQSMKERDLIKSYNKPSISKAPKEKRKRNLIITKKTNK